MVVQRGSHSGNGGQSGNSGLSRCRHKLDSESVGKQLGFSRGEWTRTQVMDGLVQWIDKYGLRSLFALLPQRLDLR